MKKKVLLISLLVVSVTNMYGQSSIFGSFADDFLSDIKSLFVPVVVAVFIVCALFNMGNFFGENRDIKKGVSSIVIYTAGTALVMGAVSYLSSLSI